MRFELIGQSRHHTPGWKGADQLAQLKDGAGAWACGIVTTGQGSRLAFCLSPESTAWNRPKTKWK